MLDSIRKAASNWLGRAVLIVIMSLLVVSFAIWGIGDMFRGSASRTIAKVGGVDIGAEAFRQSFNEDLRRLQQRARRPITTDEARAFGLDRELLNRMIDETTLNLTAKKLGLALDGPMVIRAIMEADVFKTAGIFDRAKFNDILQQSGLSERNFIAQQGESLLRQQLLSGLVGGFYAPLALGAAVHHYREEARNVEVLIIPADKAPALSDPDEATLLAYHTERKAEFRTVETRKVTLISTSSSQFSGSISVSEADLQGYYDRMAPTGRFGKPEKRRAYRILFDTEAEAVAAASKLKGGATIEAVLEEKKLVAKDVDLGLKSAGEIADAAVRAAVFALKTGETSAPVKDAFGFVLLHLAEIEAGEIKPFDAVKAEIAAEAKADKIARDPGIKNQLDDIFRKVEDQRIAGKSLAEAATAAGITATIYEQMDRNGTDGKGAKLALPGGAEVLNAIFTSDIGLDNEPIQQRDGGHIWFEINAVEPSREKSFEDVKADVKARVIADKKGRALSELAEAQLKKIENITSMRAVATELNLPIQSISGLKRGAREASLGTNGVERAFSGPIGKAVSAPAPDGVGRLILLPVGTAIPPYNPDDDAKSGFARQLSQGMGDDVMSQYTATLRKEIGVSINQSVLNQALGQQAP